MRPSIVITCLWLVWAVSWFAAALWRNPTVKRPGFRAELPYRLLTIFGAVLLFVPMRRYEGLLRLWHVGLWGSWGCAGLTVLGFLFSWWARIHLGRLWSGTVTKKTGHHVVDTGPYALVRHPIYTGLLMAIFATGVAKGTVEGLLGCLLVLAGTWIKARLEEDWLSQELGAETYQAYRARVPMLVPFVVVGLRKG